jgi:hypothetical protein
MHILGSNLNINDKMRLSLSAYAATIWHIESKPRQTNHQTKEKRIKVLFLFESTFEVNWI